MWRSFVPIFRFRGSHTPGDQILNKQKKDIKTYIHSKDQGLKLFLPKERILKLFFSPRYKGFKNDNF